MIPQVQTSRETEALMGATIHKKMTPLDEAQTYQRMKEHGYNVSMIAQLWGCGKRKIHQRLKLLTLPKKTQEQVGNGEISVRAAMMLAAMR